MQYDMEELLEQANEVQETLSRSYAVPDEIDEADLEAGAHVPTYLYDIVLTRWVRTGRTRAGGRRGGDIVSGGSKQGARFY
jgi:hypothetical protein